MSEVKPLVLVTGANGYIGSNFIESYKDKYDFVCVDKKEGIKAEEYMMFDDVSFVVHLAAISGIKDCQNDPEQAVIDNLSSTFHVFQAAFENRIPVVFASSGAAASPVSSIYAFTKFAAETEAKRLNKLGANIKCLRFTNVYGGINFLMEKSSVIASFLRQRMARQPLTINGNGEQTRDFIHIKDICTAIDLCLNEKIELDAPIDIGTGRATRIIEIAKYISQNYTFNMGISPGVMSSIADTAPAKELLEFEAPNRLEMFFLEILK